MIIFLTHTGIIEVKVKYLDRPLYVNSLNKNSLARESNLLKLRPDPIEISCKFRSLPLESRAIDQAFLKLIRR